MPDQVKDFQYYADKAEAAIVETDSADPGSRFTEWKMRSAEIYTRLAAASPKTEPKADDNHTEDVRCPEKLEGSMYQYYDCILIAGHENLHKTESGLFFDDH